MANGTTTLYISDLSIRLMVTRGRRITKLADVPLEADLSEANAEERQNELAAKIKDLFRRNNIGSRKVTLGISGLHCLTRPLTLPDLPRTMLDEAVIREARRVLPVPPEQLYISWQSFAASGGKMEAFMIGIPRYVADTMLNAIGQAGFKPSLMDIKPMALARLARVPTAVIIDVQPDEFDIVVMVNGLPQPVRTLPFPEDNISFEERMEIVRDELERTVQFHNSNNVENMLGSDTPLLVSGELADEPTAYESLAESVGFHVSLLASPLKCPKHLDPSHHLVNVGLALKQLTKDAGPLLPNFNTLPAHYQPKQLSLNRIIAIPMTAAAGALIIVLAMTVQNASANLDAVKSQLEANNMILAKRQAEKKSLTENIASLNHQIDAMEVQRQGFSVILNNLTKYGNMMNSDITASVDNVVTDLDLGGLNHSGNLLSLRGLADSEQEVMEYVRKLTATGRFSEVTISNINLENVDGGSVDASVSFILSLKLDEAQQ